MSRLVWVLVALILVGLMVGYLGCGGSAPTATDQMLGSGKGSVKVDLQRYYGSGPDVIGWAILNRLPSKDIDVLIHVEDGLPNTSYTAWVSVDPSYYHVDGTLTTNRQGKGNVRLTLSPDWVNSSYVWVYVYGSAQGYRAFLVLPWKRDSQASPPGPGVARSGVPFGDPSRAGLR